MSCPRLAVLPFGVLFTLAPAAGQQQGPIHLVFDCHCDPTINSAPLSVKQATYNQWIANLDWALDQCDLVGAKLSFLSTGWWMEFVAAGGPGGPGAVLLRRIYDHGGQIGSHHHREYRAGSNNWPDLPPNATLTQIQGSWNDNIAWVNQGITTAYSGTPPEPLASINAVKGAHVPGNEPDFHLTMQAFGMRVRQGGPEEDYYGWYGHHIWNPFRPSPLNYMDEDLNAPFVVVTQGSVIGAAQVHHGVFQDMTSPAAKRQFLQLYLNWRYRDRLGLPEKVWSWGWGSHPTDIDPADPNRAHLVDMLQWLSLHFAGRIEPTGSSVLRWSSQREAAEDYFAWESAHPGTSSFPGHSLAVNWAEYPYLRAVAEEMDEFLWIADLNLAPGVEAYHLRKGQLDQVVLWRATGTSTVDLSSLVGPRVRVVGLETGLLLATSATVVTVGQEPLVVTEDVARIAVIGTAGLGSTFTVRLIGPPGGFGSLFYSLGPYALNLPYLGQVLIDPNYAAMMISGPVTTSGLDMPISIPNDPVWLGLALWFQGVVWGFDGASARLTTNAPQVTVQ